jgi:hypothetical protein
MYKYWIFIIILRADFSKIKKNELENSKHPKFLNLARFSYQQYNENDKSNFRDHLMYFLYYDHRRFYAPTDNGYLANLENEFWNKYEKNLKIEKPYGYVFLPTYWW